MAQINHKALFDQMPVARFLVQPKEGSFEVCEANEKAGSYFGKSRSDVIDQPIDNLFIEENAKLIHECFTACLEKKMPVTIPSPRRVDGYDYVHGFWVNPIFDHEGNVLWLDVIAQPSVANTSLLERERDDALRLLTSIFDTSEVGILVTDHKRHIVKINDSFTRIYGWDGHDALGKDFTDFIDAEERSVAKRNHEEYLKGHSRRDGEVTIIRKNGDKASAWYATATLELSEGRRFQVTTLIDISERKQMEVSILKAKEQADTANHAKSAFLANMSHELRTPLNAIIGFSEMIIKETFGPLGDEKYTEYLGDIHLSARHLLEIINEVLDMSKIEAGRVELDEKEVDVSALIETVSRITTSRTFSADLKIAVDVPATFPYLYSDPRLIRQILINLVTNAVKYSPNGGTITIKGEQIESGDMILKIIDEGRGIPANRIKQAMEPFGQIYDPTHSNPSQGTGLGLPLAKAMTELHQGSLNLESEEGKGTIVTVSFPAERVRVAQNIETMRDEVISEARNNQEKREQIKPIELMRSAE